MKIDEEFKNLIPKLTNEEFKQLEENVLKEGCREPLIIWNETIIDGHNRYAICSKHNIDFKTIIKDFANREEAKMWIIKNQFGRRNLSVYDRSVLALKLEDLFKEKAKENQIVAGEKFGKGCQISDKAIENKIEPVDTKKEIAKIAGTSHDTIAKVKKIEEKAPEEVKEKVKNGEMSINQAYGYAKTYEYLENEIESKATEEIQQSEHKKIIEEQLKNEYKEIEKQRKIQQYFMKTICDAMTLTIDNEHIEAWFSDMNIEEIEAELLDINKAINNLKELETEAKIYLNKNKFKVVK
ncbi:MAG: hypothetical protein HFJ20_04545 [Clostridia bacterium]|nr:hypothetical protein [Clostridia bacterium]